MLVKHTSFIIISLFPYQDSTFFLLIIEYIKHECNIKCRNPKHKTNKSMVQNPT